MEKINLHLEKQNKQAKEPTKNWQLNQTKAQWHHPSPPVAASPSPPLHETQSGAATTTRNPLLKKQIAYISTPLRASPPSDLPDPGVQIPEHPRVPPWSPRRRRRARRTATARRRLPRPSRRPPRRSRRRSPSSAASGKVRLDPTRRFGSTRPVGGAASYW